MLISLPDLVSKYGLNIKGVIQVGCHWAQEHPTYQLLDIQKMVYIEPCHKAFSVIYDKFRHDPNIKMFQVACGAHEGEFDMYVSHNNQGQSNSLLKPLLHLQQHPEVIFTEMEKVQVVLLDNLEFERSDYNLLVMDCQGFEGEVLKGAIGTLKYIDLIFTECNRGQTYENNMEINQMDRLLEGEGFERVETFWPSPNLTWGDCCFINKKFL